jgi:hypothetical protein
LIGALALAPDLRLSNEASVEVRSAFMEARGFWSQHPARLSAAATLSDDRLALLVSLVDPAALAARMIVRVRAAGRGAFVESALPLASTMMVSLEPFAGAEAFEYSLALIDENGNRLWQAGDDDSTLKLGERATGASAPPKAVPEPPRARTERPSRPVRSPRPYYVGATISLACGARSNHAALRTRRSERQAHCAD